MVAGTLPVPFFLKVNGIGASAGLAQQPHNHQDQEDQESQGMIQQPSDFLFGSVTQLAFSTRRLRVFSRKARHTPPTSRKAVKMP